MKHVPITDEMRTELALLLPSYQELIGNQKVNLEFAPDYQNVYLCFEKDKTVLMDNHRCATWFWLKNLNKELKYNLLHIDTHFDILPLSHNVTLSKDQFESFNLFEYLNFDGRNEIQAHNQEVYLTFRWDNYIVPFIEHYFNNITNLYMIVNQTHDAQFRLGTDIIETKTHLEISYGYDILRSLDNLFDSNQNWIINFDIDFFFKNNIQIYSDEYIYETLLRIQKFVNLETSIFTVALSPSCCGGWNNCLKIIKTMKEMNLI